MMSMRHLMQDLVTLVKADGRRYPDIRAAVDPETIFIDDSSIPIEEGDFIERQLPNTLVETYSVLDRGFYARTGGIGAHYQSRVRKLTTIEAERKRDQMVIKVQGHNARVNIGSVDNSTNTVGMTGEQLFGELRKVIVEQIEDAAARASLLAAVDGMQAEQQKPGFLSHYQNFVVSAANHVTILGPFLPALTRLLA